MILNIKFFYEKNNSEHDEYTKLWNDNKERIITLDINYLLLSEQIKTITNNISDNKDILAIKYPIIGAVKRNKIINNLMLGKGFTYDINKIWYPKEIWIYNINS